LLAVEAPFKAIHEKQSVSKEILTVPVELFTSERQKAYDAHELELINRHADRLNQEAEGVLTYQMEL
jgi:N-acetyl-beta-hexosaminidase